MVNYIEKLYTRVCQLPDGDGLMTQNNLLKLIILALFILLGVIAIVRKGNAGDDILYSQIAYNQKNVDGQHCIVKTITRQKGDTVIERRNYDLC